MGDADRDDNAPRDGDIFRWPPPRHDHHAAAAPRGRVSPASGFVCPREDLAGRVRDRTVTLLDDCLDTFELYRRVAATSDARTHRRRARARATRRAAQGAGPRQRRIGAYHTAILRLRAWCEQDPDSVAREMVALMIAQVEQDLRCAAAKRVLTSGSEWEAINDAKVRAVTWLRTARDELIAGLGWPHPGEEVVVQTTYTAGSGKRAQQRTHDGLACYATSFNTANTMHLVSIPDALDHAHASWTPLRDGNSGPAMPDGDIPTPVPSGTCPKHFSRVAGENEPAHAHNGKRKEATIGRHGPAQYDQHLRATRTTSAWLNSSTTALSWAQAVCAGQMESG